MKQIDWFDYVIVNRHAQLKSTVEQLLAIINRREVSCAPACDSTLNNVSRSRR
jgi:hypothetical protein